MLPIQDMILFLITTDFKRKKIMTILFMDGCDHASSAEILKKWGGNNPSIAWSIASTGGIKGGGALTPGSSGYPLQKNLSYHVTSFVTGMAIFPFLYGTIPILTVNDNTIQHFTVYIQLDGAIVVRNSLIDYTTYANKIVAISNPGVIKSSVWQYIEIKVTIGLLGSIAINLNGKQIFDVKDVNLQSSAGNAYCTNITYSVPGDTKGFIDDLYIFDQNGSQNNDFLGKWDIDTLVPVADGINKDFTPSTGTAHWSLVNDNIPNASSYVTGSLSGNKDTYKFSSIPTNTSKIYGVQISNLAVKDNVGSLAAANLIISDGITSQSTSQEISNTESSYLSIVELDPATNAAFTALAINNAEYGVMVV